MLKKRMKVVGFDIKYIYQCPPECHCAVSGVRDKTWERMANVKAGG